MDEKTGKIIDEAVEMHRVVVDGIKGISLCPLWQERI